MVDRIMTLHPDPNKRGVNISREKYERVCSAILEAVKTHSEITFSDLVKAVQERLGDHFDGSIPWYVTTVKLDLEARQMIERIPGSSPQRLRIPG
jgi:hypothetical protein